MEKYTEYRVQAYSEGNGWIVIGYFDNIEDARGYIKEHADFIAKYHTWLTDATEYKIERREIIKTDWHEESGGDIIDSEVDA